MHYQDFELKPIDKAQEIKNLKSLFKDPLQGDFYTKETQKYFFEILAFKNKIQDSFKVKVESKNPFLSR